MKYQLQVGKAAYDLEIPYPVRWNTSDEQFLSWNDFSEKKISAVVHGVETLPEASGKVMYQEEGIEISLAENGDEIRSYRAMFAPGYPVYAKSRWDGESIQIYYNKTTNLWNHGNMQMWNLIHLENQLLDTQGISFHCCYTMYRDQAILFTAPSGTGKTTQAELWKSRYGSQIVNGDKCLLQKHEDTWEAWGYPLHGSAAECENRNLPIRAIVIVRQSKEDRVEELSHIQKLGYLYSECTVNSWDAVRAGNALDLLTDLIHKCKVIMLHCTMNENAAVVLHRYLYEEK